MNNIKKDINTPFNSSFNKTPSTSWKEVYGMQQKLVIYYVLENEALKDEIKKLRSTPVTDWEKRCIEAEKERDSLQKVLDGLQVKENSSSVSCEDVTGWKANLEKAKETLLDIWRCFIMRDDIYFENWYAIQSFANKARYCLEQIDPNLIEKETLLLLKRKNTKV
jgi:hypothetical protein